MRMCVSMSDVCIHSLSPYPSNFPPLSFPFSILHALIPLLNPPCSHSASHFPPSPLPSPHSLSSLNFTHFPVPSTYLTLIHFHLFTSHIPFYPSHSPLFTSHISSYHLTPTLRSWPWSMMPWWSSESLRAKWRSSQPSFQICELMSPTLQVSHC